MSNKKTILAVYNDPDETIAGVNHLRHKGVTIREVYTPFPVHGLDKALGLKPTRISTVTFFYGLGGLSLALWMMTYMLVWDWPMNIGGKPNFSLWDNLPSFIPVAFEITVLCAAHLMNFTYLYRTRLFPGLKAKNPDLRSTDDKFVMEIVLDDNMNISSDDLKGLIRETSVEEVNDAELLYQDK